MSARRGDSLIWTIAILIAIVWHVFIWLRFPRQNDEPLKTLRHEAPLLAYLPDYASNAATEESEVPTLMTPVLFSLPSTVGFSKPILQYKEGMLAGNYPRQNEPAFLEHSIAPRVDNFLVWPRHMDSQAAHILNNPSITKPRTTLARDGIVDPKATVHISFIGELNPAMFESMPLDPKIETEFASPWQATVSMYFDNEGLPSQVFLETPTENSDLNSAIIRNLYQWRLQSDLGPARGKAILQFN